MHELKQAAIEATEEGRISDARPLWLRLCELEPHENDHWLFLSKIDARLGFVSSARGHLNYPMNNGEFDQDIWQQAAELSFELGHFKEALRLMHRVLANDFTSTATRLHLADWCLSLDELTLAQCHFQYNLMANPTHKEALSGLVSCVLASKDQSSDFKLAQDLGPFTAAITQDICVNAVLKWQSLSTPERWADLPERASQLDPEIQKKLIAAMQESTTGSATYYASTAHVRAHQNSDTTAQYIPNLAELLCSAKNGPISIIELGAGVGEFGETLRKESAPQTSITGICLVDEEQRYLQRNSAYDLITSLDDAQTYSAKLTCDALIINQQAIRLLDQKALKSLVHKLDPQITIAIKPAELQLPDTLKKSLQNLSENGKKSDIFTNHPGRLKEPGDVSKIHAADSHLLQVINAMQAVRRGQFDKAVALVDQFDPNLESRASLKYLRGVVAQHQKHYTQAAGYLLSCLRRDTQYADGWFQLATVWQALGKEKSMLRAYRKALAIKPDHQLAAKNLIGFYRKSSNYDRVGVILQQLMLKSPIDANIKRYTANIVTSSGKQDFANWLQQFYQRQPFLRAAFDASLQSKQFDRAQRILNSLKMLISDQEAEMLTISLSEKSGDYSDALSRIEKLIVKDPENPSHQARRRSMLMATGRHTDALESWRSEIPHFKASNSGFSGSLFVGNYFADIPAQELADWHRAWGDKLALEHKETIDQSSLKPLSPISTEVKKIRVGYISGDFKIHSVSMFLYNFYLHHDREQFEIYSYSTNRANDPWALKYELLSDKWRDVSKLEKVQLVNRIRGDELDILVDLSGHTGHHRLEAMALRCAPIQGTYLGYANSTGLDAVDFRLSDEIADPPGQPASLHTENIEHIEGGFLSYRREFASPPVTLQGLEKRSSERHYTYVCCNNIFKITPQAVTLFSEILRQNVTANMLIKAHNLDNPDLRKNLYALFEANGVAQERVHLMNALDLDDHQALYNNTDVALDPFPYNGTTTTCDVLWMGVPMIALRGDRHSARVGASILTTVGREEWIAESHDEYVDKAVKLAQDKPRLLEERINLRQDMLRSPLMEPTHTIKRVEEIYTRLVSDQKN